MEIQENEFVVTLMSVGRGAAIEMFQNEFEKVLGNIADVNTAATAKREIKLIVSLKPNEDRAKCDVGIKVESKLAGAKPAVTTVYVSKVEGKLAAVEFDPSQGKLFDKPHTGNVKNFEKEKA